MKVKNFLKGRWVAHGFIAGALVLLLLFAFLPACAPEVVPPPEEEEEVVPPPEEEVGPYEEYVAGLPEGCEPVPRECFEQAMEEGQLNIYDWAEWWPEEMYTNFEQEFGIRLVRDCFADYDEVVSRYSLNPELEYDYLEMDTIAYKRLEGLGVLGEINHDWIPNVNKYLREDIKNISFAPGYKNAVIIYTSVDGYAINTRFVDETDPRLGSWEYVFEAPKDLPDHGRMTVKDSMFIVIGDTLIYLGYSANSDDEGELMEARDLLMEKVKPYVMAFDSWPKRLYLEEETWVTIFYSTGEFYELNKEVPTLIAFLPEEGTQMRGACMLIPKAAPHPAAFHLWLNFWFRPDVSFRLIEVTGRSPTHTAISALLPEDLRAWPGVVLPEGYAAKCELCEPSAFTGKGLELRTKIWEELKR